MKREFHLDDTLTHLKGASPELMKTYNQWAAVGLDEHHVGSQAEFEVSTDGTVEKVLLKWNSGFDKRAMREVRDIANFGGVSLAFFYMSVMGGYRTLTQSEIGEGTDYFFTKEDTDEEDLFGLDGMYIEVSGLMVGGESELKARIKQKHSQIDDGKHGHEQCAVLVSSFPLKRTVYESH